MRRRRKNPDSAVETALTWLGGGAAVGGGLGAIFNTQDRAMGALAGAESGVAVVGLGGLLLAVFDKPKRSEGFAAAGIGLGGLVLLGIAMGIANPTLKGSPSLGRPLLPR